MAVFVAIGVGVLLGAQRFIADANQVAHTNEVIANVDAFEARLRDAEAAQRGYLLTGNIDYLAAYQVNREQLGPLLDRLAALVSDNPQQQARAGGLRDLSDRRIEQVEANLERYRSAGLSAAQVGLDQDVLQVSSDIRNQARQLRDRERELLVARDRSSRRSADLLRALALLGIPFGILVIGLVYWRLVGEIRRRARAERANAETHRRLLDSVQQLERQSADLAELNRYGGLLLSCASTEEAVQLTTQLLSHLLPAAGGTLYRIRASHDYAEELAHWGEHASHSAAMVAPAQCWALRRGQPHLLHSGRETLRCEHIEPPAIHVALNAACIPLAAQGTQLGFIYLSSQDPALLERMDLVQAAAEHLSMALHNLQLQERLRLQSIREPLTGLFNRRYLEESLARELARCGRRGLPLSLMMLDLDHFKAFNDLHGHPGGDTLLAAFGQLLAQHARAEDIACRYGGEEFTLILPEAEADAALAIARRLVEAVRQLRVRHLGHELPAVTVSIGVASWRSGSEDGESLLHRADEALYRAKRAGRDRVELA
ncbi:GGDEF domain-containing protein [Pseudoxanthomonas daejeonensis]|uniref:sensor domain-containing diguanylate cyclase n=1 Tax=Pseudoxanthomonas daejeonensis TaxID=266062 RepID=UPI001F540FAF|nr:GGDEF domain-containing protein [Pseudoxanthomonas daejeonensis]UNK59080.1 GGDEF domain-containing protein [Pseudoxanthomonas daejeonensis]